MTILLGKLRVSFCPDPKEKGAKFTATYDIDEQPKGNFASVNPGNAGLKVGGGTLNLQFANDLWNLAWQDTDRYQGFHGALWKVAEAGQLVAAPAAVLALQPCLLAAYCLMPLDQSQGFQTSCFVDIFTPKYTVGNDKNVAMIYAIGVERKHFDCDEEFLKRVEETANNVASAVVQYNALAAGMALPILEIVRVPLISGGDFAGKCPKEKVATALLTGLQRGIGSEATAEIVPEFNLSYDGDTFRRACSSMQ